MEHVDGLDGSFAFLLQTKHQVDPLAQRLGHLVRLQRLSVDQDEQAGVITGPRGQIDMIDPFSILTNPKVKACRSKE